MKLEIFFDYICPYCYKGQKNLDSLLEGGGGLEILWRPCESHPRPEPARVHSDLAIEGMYFLQENGGDVDRYNHLVYEAHFDRGEDISDRKVLARLGGVCGGKEKEMEKALAEHRYQNQVLEGNRLAWGERRLEAVPSYCAGDLLLGSKDGIMVSRKELKAFLERVGKSAEAMGR